MIDMFVFAGFAAVAGILALYSFLERNTWMLSNIASALVSTIILWVETLLFTSGNVGTVEHVVSSTTASGSDVLMQTAYTYTDLWTPVMEPALGFLLILFSAVMTIYTILHVLTWLQDRALGNEEVEDE